MKKLFVSVPMKDRSEEAIKASIVKMHKIAEAYEGEELELISSYFTETPPEGCNPALWYLGKSLKKLAEADIFIGVADTWFYNGCYIEDEAAQRYGLKYYHVDKSIIIGDDEDCEDHDVNRILEVIMPCQTYKTKD